MHGSVDALQGHSSAYTRMNSFHTNVLLQSSASLNIHVTNPSSPPDWLAAGMHSHWLTHAHWKASYTVFITVHKFTQH